MKSRRADPGRAAQAGALAPAAVLVLVFWAATAPTGAAAADTDGKAPLCIQEGAVDANVMVFFGSSGSMNEAGYKPDDDHGFVNEGPIRCDRICCIYGDGWHRPRSVPGPPGSAR